MPKHFYSSLTRIAHLETTTFTVQPIPKADWQTGDYVVGEVLRASGSGATVELTTGRQASVSVGDHVVGALGRRAATLEAVGDWREIGPDLHMHALTSAGVFGRCTSVNSFLSPLQSLAYRGHVVVQQATLNMRDCIQPIAKLPCSIPIILIIGTSMDSGKTLSAKVIIRLLKSYGVRVAGMKFTGVGRYRDILAMSDAGADVIYDFVDAGMPSTCCEPSEFEGTVGHLLGLAAQHQVDVIVGEVGASPLEPYNGESAITELHSHISYLIMCASDPYAGVGIMQAFNVKPNLISGRATCTTAGAALSEKLCGIRAFDLLDPKSIPEFETNLRVAFPDLLTHS